MRLAPRPVEIPAPHGQLEGLLQEAEAPSFAAVVCHPHPLYGGNFNNNVTYRLARGLEEAGGAVVRFNFRGVGGSTGSYSEGIGEQDDVRAALDWLLAQRPGLPAWIAGFSFGSRVGLSVGARDERVLRLLGVGLPLSLFDFSFLLECDRPKAFIQAERDEFATAGEVKALVDRMRGPKHFEAVPDATHLFPGRLVPLEAAIARAIAFLGR